MAGMKMQVLFLVICLAAAARCCRGDDGSWANDASQKASETVDDASDTAGSWADWAYSKFSEGARKLSENDGEGDGVKARVQGAYHEAAAKAQDTYQTSNLQDTYEAAKDTVTTKVEDSYHAAKDTISPSPSE